MNYLCIANENDHFLIKQVMENIDFKKIQDAITDIECIGLLGYLDFKGKNNPRESERQTLYGDVMDWLKDCNCQANWQLNLQERNFVATYIVGLYATKQALL